MKKRIFSFLLALTLVLGLLPMSALAVERDESKDQVRVIVENTTFVTPNEEGEAPAWTGTLVDTWVDLNAESTMMSCVVAALDEVGATQQGAESNYISEINGLVEFDGGSMSGWMGTLNDWFTNEGFGAFTVASGKLSAGDEIRIMYSKSFGEDLGGSWGNNDTSLKALAFSEGALSPVFSSDITAYTLTVPATVSQVLITPTASNKNFQVHTLVGETEYKRSAMVPVEDGTVIDINVGTGLSMNGPAVPTKYQVTVAYEKAPVVNPTADMLKAVGSRMEALVSEEGKMSVGSIGGEWIALGLARNNRRIPAYYYDLVDQYVTENINDKGQLDKYKSTDNSRIIIALTAAGRDVTNVAGYNLLMGLTDMNYLVKQGINGPIWALLAFDSYGYKIPVNSSASQQVTRESLIFYILEHRLTDGGWNLTSTADQPSDADITGMALQALAPYYDSIPEVATAVDGALNALSAQQNENGGFASWGTENIESTAQVIVALCSLGIDPLSDARFIKEGVSTVDALSRYYLDNGQFCHTPNGESDGMATEQAYYALVALDRFLKDQNALYDMDDQYVLPFNDIANNIWYRDDVAFAFSTKLMYGTEDTVYSPSEELSRGQMAAILYRFAKMAANDPLESTGKLPFTDVDSNVYYAKAVLWAYENKIIFGTSETQFSPNESVTRAQMTAFLMRFMKYLGVDTTETADLSRFTDADEMAPYAVKYMSWAVAVKLIAGTSETTLSPNDPVTRAQAAAFLRRADVLLAE